MARKVIIDCDPGIDDAVALCMALFDPRLDVLAITATEGCVAAEQSNRNLQAIVERLDPPKIPRLGSACPAEEAPAVDQRYLHGDDGLGNCSFEVSRHHHQHPSDKIISDVIRSHPGQVTIVALGPLTNIARAFQRDPGLAPLVDRIIMMGGSVGAVGDITASAEFNVYYDPKSARSVFRSRTTKTLIPLDVTRQVVLNLDLMDEIPAEYTRVGRLLRQVLPFVFRSFHQRLGQESIVLNDTIAMVAAMNPSLFVTEEMAGDVETVGELTRGFTVFDRRPHPEWRPNMEVATVVDVARTRDFIVEALRAASRLC